MSLLEALIEHTRNNLAEYQVAQDYSKWNFTSAQNSLAVLHALLQRQDENRADRTIISTEARNLVGYYRWVKARSHAWTDDQQELLDILERIVA